MFKRNAKRFFTDDEKKRITETIQEAEKETSGEICVHLDSKGKGDVSDRAKLAFQKLGLTKTKHRNGILIYLSLSDQTFAIIGDEGIHARVGEEFWKEAASKMQHAFARGDFAGGVTQVIHWLGEHLKKHFPRKTDDTNELPALI